MVILRTGQFAIGQLDIGTDSEIYCHSVVEVSHANLYTLYACTCFLRYVSQQPDMSHANYETDVFNSILSIPSPLQDPIVLFANELIPPNLATILQRMNFRLRCCSMWHVSFVGS